VYTRERRGTQNQLPRQRDLHDDWPEENGIGVRLAADLPQWPIAPVEIRDYIYGKLIGLSPATLYAGVLIAGEKGLSCTRIKRMSYVLSTIRPELYLVATPCVTANHDALIELHTADMFGSRLIKIIIQTKRSAFTWQRSSLGGVKGRSHLRASLLGMSESKELMTLRPAIYLSHSSASSAGLIASARGFDRSR
jgi:hypothetical protein